MDGGPQSLWSHLRYSVPTKTGPLAKLEGLRTYSVQSQGLLQRKSETTQTSELSVRRRKRLYSECILTHEPWSGGRMGNKRGDRRPAILSKEEINNQSLSLLNFHLTQYTMIMATVVTFGGKLAFIFFCNNFFFYALTLIQTTLVPAGQWTWWWMTFKCAFIISKMKRKVTIALTTLIYTF